MRALCRFLSPVLLCALFSLAAACGKGSSSPDSSAPLPDGGPEDTAPGADSTGQPELVLDSSAPEVLPDGPAVPDSAAECSAGEQGCQDASTAVICQGGHWVVAQVCAEGTLCLETACVTAEVCQPGHVKGCYSLSQMSVCHSSGKGYVPFPCPEGEKCVGGQCGELVCNPNVRQCEGTASYVECLDDGSGWGESMPCEEGTTCIGGKCLGGCGGDPKYNLSNVGCEFWSVDLGQWDVKEGETSLDPPASGIPHAVIVGNPNEVPVQATFETGDGTPVEVLDPVVLPGQVRAFVMPVMSLQETGITKKTIRLRTNHPVTAAQFNPPNNEDYVHTTDASLLYPISILGKEHYVVTMPSMIGMELPMFGKMPSVWGYVTVVAVEPGITKVDVVALKAPTEPGPDFPGYQKGDTFSVELEQWEVFNLASLATDMMATPLDMSGTQVLADQKVAVFGAHDCYVIGDSNCDHLETQLLPVEAWGTSYVAVRMNTPAPNQYRVVAGTSGTAILTAPPVAGLDGAVLAKGEVRHVTSDSSFELTASGPVQVIQFIAGNSSGGSTFVDPSMTTLIPIDLFRNDYPILVPTAYDENYVSVARLSDTPISLNGQPVVAAFLQIPGSDWQVANVPVPEGVNQLTADSPFGLISYGYAMKVSYAYPGGLNGKAAQ
jgi:hypothetical protein